MNEVCFNAEGALYTAISIMAISWTAYQEIRHKLNHGTVFPKGGKKKK